MKALLTTTAASLIVAAGWAGGNAAEVPMCPPEVASAKAMLNARGGQLSRSYEAQTQIVMVSYNRGTEARRTQDAQPTDRDDLQTPPSSATTPSASQRAQVLVKEAEAACKDGDTALATEKALAALEVMKQ